MTKNRNIGIFADCKCLDLVDGWDGCNEGCAARRGESLVAVVPTACRTNIPDVWKIKGDIEMKLKKFLKMHKDGCCYGCVTIEQLPYNHERHRFAKAYFEEADQEDILASPEFQRIADKQIDSFSVIGGGMYPVELCIFLKEE